MRRTLDGSRPIATALTPEDHSSQTDSAEDMQLPSPSSRLSRGSIANGLPTWPPQLAQLASDAWAQQPTERPTIDSLAKRFLEHVRRLLIAAGDHWADVSA
jgi:hypothetical protein